MTPMRPASSVRPDAVAPGAVVHVRLMGSLESVATVAGGLHGALSVTEESRDYPRRRDLGVRRYLTVAAGRRAATRPGWEVPGTMTDESGGQGERLDVGAEGFCLEWRYRALVSRPVPRTDPHYPDQIVVWECRHTDHRTAREAHACGERYIRERQTEQEAER